MTSFVSIAWISLGLAVLSAMVIAIDEIRHPQKMWIMNIVWPVTALYLSVFALWGYFHVGRRMTKKTIVAITSETHHHRMEQSGKDPTVTQVAISDSHCGAGCTIGDIIAEFSLFGLGWTLLGSTLPVQYAGDLLLAWLLGIAFQYFTIKPMRNLSAMQGLIAAVKADTLSILTFEIGLFAWMALSYFVLFPDHHLTAVDPGYWFMMQIGMIFGFLTSYPMNRRLIKIGWKEAMG